MAIPTKSSIVKVAGIWEQGWNTPILEYDLWDFPLKDFGVDEFIMTPISGINKKVTEYPSIEEALEENRDLTPVYVDEKGKTDLQDFTHPKNAIYITGKTSQSIMKDNELSVRVKTVRDKGYLWAHQAMCLVLYDRMIKNKNRGIKYGNNSN